MTNAPLLHACKLWAHNRLLGAYVPTLSIQHSEIAFDITFQGCFAQSDDDCCCHFMTLSGALQTAKTYILAADLPGIPRERIRVGT